MIGLVTFKENWAMEMVMGSDQSMTKLSVYKAMSEMKGDTAMEMVEGKLPKTEMVEGKLPKTVMGPSV